MLSSRFDTVCHSICSDFQELSRMFICLSCTCCESGQFSVVSQPESVDSFCCQLQLQWLAPCLLLNICNVNVIGLLAFVWLFAPFIHIFFRNYILGVTILSNKNCDVLFVMFTPSNRGDIKHCSLSFVWLFYVVSWDSNSKTDNYQKSEVGRNIPYDSTCNYYGDFEVIAHAVM